MQNQLGIALFEDLKEQTKNTPRLYNLSSLDDSISLF